MAVKWIANCPSHPEPDGNHECLEKEMRCAYCGERIEPYPCNGCGRFLTVKQMHDIDPARCDKCA